MARLLRRQHYYGILAIVAQLLLPLLFVARASHAPAATQPTKAADEMSRGKKLYNQYLCVTCHGPDLRGGIGNPLVGPKSEDFISKSYIEEFVGKVVAHKSNFPEIAKIQQHYNSGQWKDRKKPLSMLVTMAATLSSVSPNPEEISEIAAYIMDERATATPSPSKTPAPAPPTPPTKK